MCQENLLRETTRRHPDQEPKLSNLTAFDSEEQYFHSKLRPTDDEMPATISEAGTRFIADMLTSSDAIAPAPAFWPFAVLQHLIVHLQMFVTPHGLCAPHLIQIVCLSVRHFFYLSQHFTSYEVNC